MKENNGKEKNLIMKHWNESQTLAARPRAGGFPVLFLLAGLLAMVAPLPADQPPTFLFMIDFSAAGGGFQPALYVAVGSSNNLYVDDFYNNRVKKLSRNGNYLTQWGGPGTGNGQFSEPLGVAVDRSNNVYVTDLINNRVQKFDSSGNYLTQWGSSGSGNGQFVGPQGLALDSSNNVYVADYSNNRVEKFSSSGSYLTQWGSDGSGNGEFSGPVAVAVDSSNNVYVTDYGNNRVEKFDSNGNYVTQWGSYGSDNSQFIYPQGIAVDSSNNVYVTDYGNNRVEKFDSNGNYLTQWGSSGSGNGQFGQPQGVAVDSSGNFIYVADVGNDRLQVFVNSTNIIPPIITSQPTNQTVVAGMSGINVTFSVSVVGTAPFAYQWTSNNISVPGATNATLTLTNVAFFASGSKYSVRVTNSYGSLWTSNAVVTVLPALAATLPASGISFTGAVLNGSVTIGPVATVAWFDWGTDTNYGNIAGITLVPGNNGSNNISTTLNGLIGNLYHCRIVAANDFGVVYGNDQLFAVGFAPTATTLAAVNSANGTTFNATVNPNGADTTVYFRWGSTAYVPNLTPSIDIGAGTTSLNVSSFITGLTQGTSYYFRVVASNALAIRYGSLVSFSPPFTSAPLGTWQSVASSADGRKLIAGAVPGGDNSGTYTSTNGGATWTRVSGVAEGVASSADGTKLMAVYQWILISTNSGALWKTATTAPSYTWNAIASSADGTKLVAVGGGVYTSTNSGVNWTPQTNGLASSVVYAASSADGSKLVVAGSPFIFTSTNFGVNWTRATNAPWANWYSVASSADGIKLMACAYNFGSVYLSTDAGVTWTKTGLPTNNWNSVAESADGTKMVALANSGSSVFGTGGGGIFTSTNSGATWVSNNVPSGAWTCAALSADGNELIATIGSPSTSGGIYVSQTAPAPVLNLSVPENNTVISWITPSLNFTLQQSPDLTSWTAVTNLPVLNLTNLQNQVVLPPRAGNSFFRLKH